MTKELLKIIYGVAGRKARHRCPFCFRNFETRRQYDAHWDEAHGPQGPSHYPELNPADGVIRIDAIRAAKSAALRELNSAGNDQALSEK